MHEQSIFIEALERDSAERVAYLDQACAADPTLRQRIERLLERHQQGGSFLDEPIAKLSPTVDESVRERPGTIIGPYKLLEQIGEGGFGVVFMAEQMRPVRRKVALKILKPGMDTRQVVARFEAERQALALMDHPQIAHVFDGGETVTGRPYFVMELVRGIPITEFCDQGQLPVDERLELFISVCQAVQHAHHKGIIHRDLKPTNVLVTMHDDKPVVKVIDFGIAKATGSQLTEKTLFTNFAQMIGTPMYMSPEQAQMSGLDVDTRSDIYSLGVLLYELLTGTTPFDKERLRTAAYDEIRRIIREEEPPRPSTRFTTLGQAASTVSAKRRSDPVRLSQQCRGELDWIVMKAMEKDRNRRYQTANSLAADVQRYLADEPVQACPPATWYRFGKFARRHKTAVLTAACAVLCFVVAGAAVLWREKVAADKAIAVAQENEKEATKARKKVENSLYFESIARAHLEWWNNDVGRADQILEQCAAGYRNWEWHYLKGLCQSALFDFRGHKDIVPGVAFSPDGSRLASASADKTIKVWDLETGREFLPLQGHKERVRCVCFSPDGRWLASCGGTWGSGGVGEFKVWDLATGRVHFEQTGHGEVVMQVAFRPDGKMLASVGYDTIVKLWDLETGQLARSVPTHGSHIRCVAFSPDGERMATGHADSKITLFAATDDRVIDTLWARQSLQCLAFSPDGKRLLAGDYSGTATLWDLETKQSVPLLGHAGIVYGVAFSPDGRSAATASADGSVKIWELATYREQTIRGHTGEIYAVAFSPGGRCLATAGWDRTVKVFDRSKPQASRTLSLWMPGGHGSHWARVVFSPDGKRIAAAARESAATYTRPVALQVWDSATSEVLLRIERPRGFMSAAFSPDGKRLAADWGNDIKVFDARTGWDHGTLKGHAQQVNAVVYHPSEQRLASGGDDGTVMIWDVAGGKALRTLLGHTKPVTGIAFHPAGKLLASSSQDGTWRLWEAESGRAVLTGSGDTEALNWIAFAPSGEHFATAGGDGKIRVWDTRTGATIQKLPAHVGSATGVCYSADGLRLASSGSDSKVRIWDAQTGQEALTLKSLTRELHSVAFCPLGRRLAAGHVLGSAVSIWEKPDDPPDGAARNHLVWRMRESEGFAALRQWPAAFAHLDRLIAAQPTNADWLFRRGKVHGARGDSAQAITDYWRAVERDPQHLALRALFSAMRDQGNREPTIAFFKAETQAKPLSALAHWCLGNAQWRQGKVSESLASFQLSSELDPNDPRYHYSLGNNLSALNRLDEAIVAYTKAIDLEPRDPYVRHALGVALRRGGRFEQAIAVWKAAVEVDSRHVWSHSALAWHLATAADPKKRDHESALVHARLALELKSGEANHWSNLGVALWRAGDSMAAVEKLEKADGMWKGGDLRHRFFLAMAYWQTGEKDKARQAFEQGAQWMDQHQPNNEELRRFRTEAEELMKTKSKQ